MYRNYNSCYANKTLKRISKSLGLSPATITKYLQKANGNLINYEDYIDAAKDIGYDLSVHNVVFPKDLTKAHDDAASIRTIKIDEIEKKKAIELYASLSEKYSYETKDFLIRPPKDTAEIIKEGNALKHCVGGYASRHAKGQTVILFMRSKAHPNKPLYTIEMHGKQLRQARGFGNMTTPKSTPESKAFFDEWLKYVKTGKKKREKASTAVLAC